MEACLLLRSVRVPAGGSDLGAQTPDARELVDRAGRAIQNYKATASRRSRLSR